MLQEGQAGTDVAMAVASTAANLDTRAAKATSETDRQMIHVPRSRVTRVERVNKCGELVEEPCASRFVLFVRGKSVLQGCCFRFFALSCCVLPLPPCLLAPVSFGDLCCGLLCPAAAALSPGLCLLW